MFPVLAAVVPAASPFAQAFTGSWNCSQHIAAASGRPAHIMHSDWIIAPAAGSRNWTIVRWGPHGEQGGTAYVGYVPRLRTWLYDDFHGDGSYARSTSRGPHGGTWAWYGTYYTSDAQLSYGPILWSVKNNRLERKYEQTVAGHTRQLGADSCAKE